MINIPISNGQGIHYTMSKFAYHAGTTWIGAIIIVLLILFFIGMIVHGFIADCKDDFDINIENSKPFALCWFIPLALLSFIIFASVGVSNVDKSTITHNYSVIKHSNIAVKFAPMNHQNSSKYGDIYIKKWGNKIAKIDYTNMSKIVIKPTNNVGKATINMMKLLKSKDVKKHVNMKVYSDKVVAKKTDFYGKHTYTIYTKEPNKIIVKQVKNHD